MEKLVKQRDDLLQRAADIDKMLNGHAEKATASTKRTKSKKSSTTRSGSLNDLMSKVLDGGKVMSASELEAAVLKAGYKTKSKSLINIIRQSLNQSDKFVRVQRGMYTVTS
jgi:hypothetical protein